MLCCSQTWEQAAKYPPNWFLTLRVLLKNDGLCGKNAWVQVSQPPRHAGWKCVCDGNWSVVCLQTLFVRVKHFICSPIILSTLNWCKKRKVGQRCKFSDKGNNYPPKCCRAAGLLQAVCCRCRSLQQHLITITRAEQATQPPSKQLPGDTGE